MRSVVTAAVFAVGLAAALPAGARCASDALWTFPDSGAELPANGRVLLTGYGASSARVADAARAGGFFLRAGAARIRLAAEVRPGEMRVTQVWLSLPPGARAGRWQLSADDPALARALASHHFQVRAARDETAPRWQSSAEVVRGTTRAFGCGPARHLELAVPADAALVEVRGRLTTPDGEVRALPSFLFRVEDGVAQVGHGMCSGGHVPVEGARYDVEVVGWDIAGNASRSPFAERLSFTARLDG